MNYCTGCGTKLDGEPKFCPECGTPVAVEKQSAARPNGPEACVRVARFTEKSPYRDSPGLDFDHGEFIVANAGPTRADHVRVWDAAGDLEWTSPETRLWALETASKAPTASKASIADRAGPEHLGNRVHSFSHPVEFFKRQDRKGRIALLAVSAVIIAALLGYYYLIRSPIEGTWHIELGTSGDPASLGHETVAFNSDGTVVFTIDRDGRRTEETDYYTTDPESRSVQIGATRSDLFGIHYAIDSGGLSFYSLDSEDPPFQAATDDVRNELFGGPWLSGP